MDLHSVRRVCVVLVVASSALLVGCTRCPRESTLGNASGPGAGDPEWDTFVARSKVKVLADAVFLDPEHGLLPCHLAIRAMPSGAASDPPRKQLVMYCDTRVDKTIQRLEDLWEHRQLASAPAALSYLRLLTDERTRSCGLEDWYGWEVLAGGTLLNRSQAVDRKVLAALPWHPPAVELTADGTWRVTRVVLRKPGDDSFPRQWDIVDLTEEVSSASRSIVKERAIVAERVLYHGPLEGVTMVRRH